MSKPMSEWQKRVLYGPMPDPFPVRMIDFIKEDRAMNDPRVIRSVRIVELVRVAHVVGKGVPGDPVREAEAYFDPKSGKEIAFWDSKDGRIADRNDAGRTGEDDPMAKIARDWEDKLIAQWAREWFEKVRGCTVAVDDDEATRELYEKMAQLWGRTAPDAPKTPLTPPAPAPYPPPP